MSRCEDEDNPSYKDYGGRGIKVCDEWQNFSIFYEWCESRWVPGGHIDRIDVDGPYSPNNCQFVTRTQNNRNKRNNKVLTAFGESKCMAEWAEDPRCLVSEGTFAMRVNRDWDVEAALTTVADGTRKGRVAPNAGVVTAWGEIKTVSGWLKDDRCLIKNSKTLWLRINKYSWPPEKAMTQPIQAGRPRKQ